MTVFKTYWKIVKKNIGIIILYTVMLLVFGTMNLKANKNSFEFISSKPDIIIVNNSSGIITDNLSFSFPVLLFINVIVFPSISIKIIRLSLSSNFSQPSIIRFLGLTFGARYIIFKVLFSADSSHDKFPRKKSLP